MLPKAECFRKVSSMDLESLIVKELAAGDPLAPLPTTRELGERFGISHVTVSRVLRKLAETGKLWQAHSGRFYAAEAEAQLSRPRPVGCLVRSLSGWAAWYERIMTGVSLGCEMEERGILVHPVADMVIQAAPDARASFMGKSAQRKVMERYIQRHAGSEQKLLLDDTWSDAVLREYAARLPPARLLLRPSPVAAVPSIHPDYAQGAMLGLSHLLGLGYKKICFVQPYKSYATTREFERAFTAAVDAIGVVGLQYEVFESDGTEGFGSLARRLKTKAGRGTALVCPEDNFSVSLLASLEEVGIELPGQVGLLGGMGTEILARAGISRLVVDFVELGRRAVTTRAVDWTEDLTMPFGLTRDRTT